MTARSSGMSARSEPAENSASDGERIETDIDTVLAAFDGDPRAAIRSLLIANEFLMEEVDRLRASLSVGYVRGSQVRNS
jgi:hypothetical protein